MRRAPLNYAGVPDVVSIPGLYDDAMVVTDAAEDGVPHRSCCQDCAFLDKSQVKHIMAACAEKGAAFYCVHREGETPTRVCAGFDKRKRRTLSDQQSGDRHEPG